MVNTAGCGPVIRGFDPLRSPQVKNQPLFQGFKYKRHFLSGVLSEWFKVQSWKGCVVHATMSSNLIDSAIVFVEPLDKGFFIVFLLHTEKYTENNYFVKC